jgi:NADH-quinone oxidoreductase subunit M
MLWLVQRVFFGPLKEPESAKHHAVSDLTLREILALAPLAVFVVWIGIRPSDVLSRMEPTLELARQPAAAYIEAEIAAAERAALEAAVESYRRD